jgi:DNA ligase-associated metallophosphoesterase
MRADEPHLKLGDTAFRIAPEGALIDEGSGSLIVSDLHFEKGSAHAVRGLFLPPYDTRATLAALGRVVQRHAPRLVVCLGDSFHDVRGPERLDAEDRAALLALQRGRDWIWVAGNHDPSVPTDLGGIAATELRLDNLVLRHEPVRGTEGFEIAGHLHPVAVVRGPGRAVRRRCVASDGRRAVMPAFGALAGGLDIRDSALSGLFDTKRLIAFVLGETEVHPVPWRRCG